MFIDIALRGILEELVDCEDASPAHQQPRRLLASLPRAILSLWSFHKDFWNSTVQSGDQWFLIGLVVIIVVTHSAADLNVTIHENFV